MLVLAPVACILGAIGGNKIQYIKGASLCSFIFAVSSTLETYMKYIKPKKGKSKGDITFPIQKEVSYVVISGLALMLIFYVFHCTWVTSEAYSSPSIVLAAKQYDGSRMIFDDFREATDGWTTILHLMPGINQYRFFCEVG